MNNILKNSEASVIKLVTELQDQMLEEGICRELTYVEIDARVELKDGDLPNTDIIGVTQFSISEEEEKIWSIHFILAVSTVSDDNLFRLRDMVNWVFNRFHSGAQMIYYDADSADEKSWIQVIPGTVMLPTHRVETRPFRFVQVHALLDPQQGSQTAY
jgi:hypothetical protein